MAHYGTGRLVSVCVGEGVLEVQRQIRQHVLKIALHAVGVRVVHVKTFVQVYYLPKFQFPIFVGLLS